jgi:tetratricopeptide (TPR) repeat protein
MAAVEQKRGDAKAAIAACRTGLEHTPTAARLHYSLGQLLRQECEFSQAADAYARAQEHGYDTPELYINRLEALSDAGDIEGALRCADSGLAQFPDSAPLHKTRAHLHWEAGLAGDPVEPLRSAARAHPGNATLWYTLARLLDRLGRRDDSVAAIAEARKHGCPESPELLMQEALCCAYTGDDAEATARFDRLVQRFPDHLDAKLTFAQHLLGTGDPARAESLCASVLGRHPHDQLAWCYRGTAWQLMADEREHWLMDYERMVRRVPVPPPEGYPDTEAFMAAVQEALEELHQTQAHPIEQSVRGGTQTNGFLFRLKHPLLAVLERQIRLAITEVLAGFPEDAQHPFWGRKASNPRGDGIRFSGAWSVRLRSEGYHTHHIHPEGWISSALYIALPDEVRAGADNAGHIQFGVPMAELGLDLPPRRTIRPEVGSLALFPSYMWHGTVPFTSEQPRITVAFDLQPQA